LSDTLRLERIATRPGLGRSLIEHDPRSLNYPVDAIMPAGAAPYRTKTWRRPGAYDQGATSSCVGQTFKGILNTSPNTAKVPAAFRHQSAETFFYPGAQRFDQWPGEEPTYEGSSSLGACNFLLDQKAIASFHWCFSIDAALQALSYLGPVGIGIWYHADMFTPDANGFLSPTGGKVGGHEIELHGINAAKRYVEGTQSWGVGWGPIRGRFRLTFDHLAALLDDDGDAVVVQV
jgi:hypothetical protein